MIQGGRGFGGEGGCGSRGKVIDQRGGGSRVYQGGQEGQGVGGVGWGSMGWV